MRYAVFALITTMFFSFLLYYAVSNVSPWDREQLDIYVERYSIETGTEFNEFIDEAMEFGLIWTLLDIRNFTILLTLMGAVIVSGVSAMHLAVDKFFVKRFYESPNVATAVRRGLLVYLVVIALVLLKLIAGLFWYNALAVTIITISFEYGFINYLRERRK